jgi:hypothetical protein
MNRIQMGSAVFAASLSLFLSGCATPPPANPVPVLQPLTTQNNDACCYQPAEIVKYQDKRVAECAKSVEVVRYKNTCHDCSYPIVVRTDSLCTSNK